MCSARILRALQPWPGRNVRGRLPVEHTHPEWTETHWYSVEKGVGRATAVTRYFVCRRAFVAVGGMAVDNGKERVDKKGGGEKERAEKKEREHSCCFYFIFLEPAPKTPLPPRSIYLTVGFPSNSFTLHKTNSFSSFFTHTRERGLSLPFVLSFGTQTKHTIALDLARLFCGSVHSHYTSFFPASGATHLISPSLSTRFFYHICHPLAAVSSLSDLSSSAPPELQLYSCLDLIGGVGEREAIALWQDRLQKRAFAADHNSCPPVHISHTRPCT